VIWNNHAQLWSIDFSALILFHHSVVFRLLGVAEGF
jgi:hypothetical protein